ncbi:MAG: amino acid permease [Sedimentisphaerales bacterium]|nr:amino acid permease [Sedimentisphaerales bacterium]
MKQIDGLKKELALADVFAIASGAMISSGLFVLPAIAYAKAGPAVILSYFFASLLIIPSILCQAELGSAMPRAGGMYFYVERSFGAIPGLFTGLADWFSLALKIAFAVVGIAIFIELALLQLFGIGMASWQLKAIAIISCIVFTVLNIVSVKHTSKFQILLVISLLVILAIFILSGVKKVEFARYDGFFDKGWLAILATSGLVFISFGGLNKVVNVAEEVREPGRNLPLGMLLAWLVVSFFYITVIAITVGVVDGSELSGSLMPISLAASKIIPFVGFGLLGIAAVAAFVTTANAGILAASRSPMAMSRDTLLPPVLCHVSERFKTPHISILLTSGSVIAAVTFLDVETLAKTASTLLIILYILGSASVIIMRESKIQSYRPKFKSPLYPYMHFFAIIAYSALIIGMGKLPLLIAVGFVGLSSIWYLLYVSKRVSRASAAMHVVERVTDRELKTVTLEDELRDILLERDDVIGDRFDQLIKKCEIIDVKGPQPADKVFRQSANILSHRLGIDESVLFEKFLHREAEGSTVIQPGLAIPHIVVEGENKFDILLVRAVDGINFPHTPEPVRAMFILSGSKDERNYHLRALMAIAQITQEKDFEQRWLAARDIETIRNLILLSTRKRGDHP